ncbi:MULTISPECIES: phage baseplate assembly protein V [unclassified Paraburkholderia]|uniref:phage baseplate assembly protein V n=1 Tax=unclassified Paraburkholderia TaxID=2615204 RepID=UPI002AB23956|nr:MULTISPECIES: phage baseplate assembly protein V [unclassified Paraburkholderia]
MDANEFRRLIVNLIRKGSVLDVNLTSNPPTCRVCVGDPDDTDNPGLQTNWIPFLSLRAGTTREWNPPTKGEQVILFCPMGDPAQGVALAGLNSENFPAPSTSAGKHLRVYPDDAVIEYDHAAHALTATLPDGATVLIVAPGAVNVQTKNATVQADDITLDAKQTTVTGAMLVKGAFEFQSGMTGASGEGAGAVMKIKGDADFDGEVKSKGISLPRHTHREQGDGELVSDPQ